ncbi:unnamed protein product [Lactuca virosa]|uniref:Fatty acyl-CoA reductase n=1 Tax=Lactuca virosa TaxID=75947 RepID=A0AAU9N045_9ASTR|nr:unnamed protein product [Lactuca virosa]
MELGGILDVLDKKTILVTVFVEKILRVQPNVKKLYLLVRATDNMSALQRFNTEVVAKDLFKVLKEKYHTKLQNFLSEKVILVPGDITCENLGVKDSCLKEDMWRDVEVVVNSAASTDFYERYDVSLDLNTFGAKFVLDFAKKCINIKLLLHVSTAYVSGEKSGMIHETPCYLGQILDIKYEKMILEDRLKELEYHNANEEAIKMAMKDLGTQRANHCGWPNTYVFTKALGEMVLHQFKGDIPLVILRPTIITSTYKEPFPGWIEGIRTIDSFIVGYGKGRLKCFPADPECVYDVVPADMVVNAMIAAIMANTDQTSSETIYHIGSSVSNPLKYTIIQKCTYLYFTQHPWTKKDRKSIIVRECKVLKSMASFHRYITLRYLLPLQVLIVVNVILCQAFAGTCKNIERKINLVLRLVKLYQPYLFSTSLYHDINTEKLRNMVRESKHDDVAFYFDPKIIDWEDYFLHTHIPGVPVFHVRIITSFASDLKPKKRIIKNFRSKVRDALHFAIEAKIVYVYVAPILQRKALITTSYFVSSSLEQLGLTLPLIRSSTSLHCTISKSLFHLLLRDAIISYTVRTNGSPTQENYCRLGKTKLEGQHLFGAGYMIFSSSKHD